MTTTTIQAPTTDAELCRLAGIELPINWDELGSSAKDRLIETRARGIRRTIPVDVRVSAFEAAMDAWFWLYHQRVNLELKWENETGLCSACGERITPGSDHDEDTEEAQELGEKARRGKADIVVTSVPGTNIPMAYVVSEQNGRWTASFGPY